MSRTLTLPRSALLALWLGCDDDGRPNARGQLDRAVRAVQSDDEPHTVEDALTGATTTLAESLATWLTPGGEVQVVALFPAPGDVQSVPAAVSVSSLHVGECVLLRAPDGRDLALVPQVSEFGSPYEPGHVVRWRATPVPEWITAALALGSLTDADRDLRIGLATITQALIRLDIAHWDSRDTERVAAIRDGALAAWRLPEHLDGRRARVLASAARLRAIADLAGADDGAAINVWQADQRSAALRDVDRMARRALAAATASLIGRAAL
ncbi:hypothetical protein [Cellulomonas composti]|uniref:Uncharacterized protein n=1 Tax=Cellulomonas composti TaxID=266130 RepID=A0A511J5V9_9CELL|nr:hypothetical protein [Cellulomonas composti]GEL93388.1 hypothetical protein CCO02nite_00460 [Cellulomonas composti]